MVNHVRDPASEYVVRQSRERYLTVPLAIRLKPLSQRMSSRNDMRTITSKMRQNETNFSMVLNKSSMKKASDYGLCPLLTFIILGGPDGSNKNNV